MATSNTNLNAARNGTRIRPMLIGELPAKLLRVTRASRAYRRFLEEQTVQRHGEISAEHAHLIDEATAHETHSMICRWLLRNKFDLLNPTDLLACSREMAAAKTRRNKAVEILRLRPMTPDEEREHVARLLYGPREPYTAAPATNSAPAATELVTQQPDATAGHRCDCGACETSESVSAPQAGQGHVHDTHIPIEGNENERTHE